MNVMGGESRHLGFEAMMDKELRPARATSKLARAEEWHVASWEVEWRDFGRNRSLLPIFSDYVRSWAKKMARLAGQTARIGDHLARIGSHLARIDGILARIDSVVARSVRSSRASLSCAKLGMSRAIKRRD